MGSLLVVTMVLIPGRLATGKGYIYPFLQICCPVCVAREELALNLPLLSPFPELAFWDHLRGTSSQAMNLLRDQIEFQASGTSFQLETKAITRQRHLLWSQPQLHEVLCSCKGSRAKSGTCCSFMLFPVPWGFLLGPLKFSGSGIFSFLKPRQYSYCLY